MVPGNFLMSFLMGVVILFPSVVQLRNAFFHCSQSKMANAASLDINNMEIKIKLYKIDQQVWFIGYFCEFSFIKKIMKNRKIITRWSTGGKISSKEKQK